MPPDISVGWYTVGYDGDQKHYVYRLRLELVTRHILFLQGGVLSTVTPAKKYGHLPMNSTC